MAVEILTLDKRFSSEEIYNLNETTGRYFDKENKRFRACVDTIKMHSKNRKFEEGAPEIKAYANAYNRFEYFYNGYMEHLRHFNHIAAGPEEIEATRAELLKYLEPAEELLKKIQELDKAFINLDGVVTPDEAASVYFWNVAPINDPENNVYKGKNGFDLKSLLKVGGFLALLFIAIICYVVIPRAVENKKTVESTAVTIGEGTGIEYADYMTLPDYFYYSADQTVANDENTVTLNGYDVVLGKTTVLDLYKSGIIDAAHFYASSNEVLDKAGHFKEKLSYSYIEPNYYDYLNIGLSNDLTNTYKTSDLEILDIHPIGNGTACFHEDSDCGLRVDFVSFQQCESYELDWSKCIINSISYNYVPGGDNLDFYYMGINTDTTMDEILELFDEKLVVKEDVAQSDNYDYYHIGIDRLIKMYVTNYKQENNAQGDLWLYIYKM